MTTRVVGVASDGCSVVVGKGASVGVDDEVTVTNVVGFCVGASTTELGDIVTETVVVYPIVWSTVCSTVWVTTEGAEDSVTVAVGAGATTDDVSVGAAPPCVTVIWFVTVSMGFTVTVTWDPDAALDALGAAPLPEPPLKIFLADGLS